MKYRVHLTFEMCLCLDIEASSVKNAEIEAEGLFFADQTPFDTKLGKAEYIQDSATFEAIAEKTN